MKRFLVVLLGVIALSGPVRAEALPDIVQNDPDVPSVSSAGYDVTIVVFFDYRCPHCRVMSPRFADLLREDKKVRIVYRDWPIFGGPSIEAARAAMASRYQGKHEALDTALMSLKGKLTSEGVQTAMRVAGVDPERLQADLVAHKAEIDAGLARTDGIAQAIGLSGTPAMIVGSYLVPGEVDLEDLRGVIKAARHQSVSQTR